MVTAEIPTRERLLTAAAELFYREGITAVGVDKICQRAQVSKRSLYGLFRTKDELVAASLEQFGSYLSRAYLPNDESGRSPRERILHVFSWLEASAATDTYEGCPFVATATELKDPAHPGSIVAKRFKNELTAFFEREAAAAGASNPPELAQQLTVVFDGCGDRVVVDGYQLRGLATRMASTLLDAAGAQ